MIIVDGISGAGKTTMLVNLVKQRGFIDYGIHRATGTDWVHGSLSQRYFDMTQMRKWENDMEEVLPTIYILVDADTDIAHQRQTFKKDLNLDENPKIVQSLFHIHFDFITSFKNKIKIDTSEDDLETCLTIVSDFIKGVENDYYKA